ncbi:MAG: UDP-N-acetylmuramate dehydrogenase [Clostridia bacterium]|nr:UDP-N-acetylmuramate dehydrogenase [Clostridia bacterium]
MRVGGIVKILIISYSLSSLLQVCKTCNKHNIMYKIIGLGANVIFSDSVYNGVVIINRSNSILVENNSIIADSGTSVGSIISLAKSHNLSGLEDLSGIPSTLGGAMINNLGAHTTEIGDLVEYVECYDTSMKKLVFLQDQCGFGYRTSIFQSKEYIITRVKLNLYRQDNAIIDRNICNALIRKHSTQPLDQPSAGSIFKRIDSVIPAKIIDELGLKGTSIGGAMISTKHAGFIVNFNNATAADIRRLIDQTIDYVYKMKNIRLTLEIEFVEFEKNLIG